MREHKERPILFSGPLVRAILEGRKTQTRRLQGLDALNAKPDAVERVIHTGGVYWQAFFRDGGAKLLRCPFGEAGDRLWVREAWGLKGLGSTLSADVLRRAGAACKPGVLYKADGAKLPAGLRWRPSIHMYRWASRIDLRVTSIRCERLQNISEEDAKAEGVTLNAVPGHLYSCHRRAFTDLWDQINAKRAPWAKSPWVWVVSFKREPSHD